MTELDNVSDSSTSMKAGEVFKPRSSISRPQPSSSTSLSEPLDVKNKHVETFPERKDSNIDNANLSALHETKIKLMDLVKNELGQIDRMVGLKIVDTESLVVDLDLRLATVQAKLEEKVKEKRYQEKQRKDANNVLIVSSKDENLGSEDIKKKAITCIEEDLNKLQLSRLRKLKGRRILMEGGSQMLNKSVIILFLVIVLCHKICAQSCEDRQLGRPQNLTFHIDQVLFIFWLPPSGFGNCAVTYSIHIQNRDTWQYFIPVVHLSGLNYIFDYDKHCKTCLNVNVRLFAHYNGQTSDSHSLSTFLEPVVEQGPPTSIHFNRTETSLGVHWSFPEGFENCGRLFSNMLTITLRGTNQFMIQTLMRSTYNSFYFWYPDGHPLYCQEVDVELAVTFRGRTTITGNTILGPPRLC
ncbi:uncharacterized protein [Onthophagus taurus]|uniref:uncharacterized protein n=1 Tax=Onthophagus taurus TaxID=166361 RepID=UPI0039BE4231